MRRPASALKHWRQKALWELSAPVSGDTNNGLQGVSCLQLAIRRFPGCDQRLGLGLGLLGLGVVPFLLQQPLLIVAHAMQPPATGIGLKTIMMASAVDGLCVRIPRIQLLQLGCLRFRPYHGLFHIVLTAESHQMFRLSLLQGISGCLDC